MALVDQFSEHGLEFACTGIDRISVTLGAPSVMNSRWGEMQMTRHARKRADKLRASRLPPWVVTNYVLGFKSGTSQTATRVFRIVYKL